jgi:hypothetical protein
MTAEINRRGAIGMLAAGVGASIPVTAWPKAVSRPILATPEQLAAEREVMRLERDPEVVALKQKIRGELLGAKFGKLHDGAITLERAVDQWTRSLIFGELGKHRATPAFLWGTDDTPRHWYGHELGGVGTSGDNTDAIYRTAIIDGSRQYELTGQLDPVRRVTQLVIQLDAADLVNPASMMDVNHNPPRMLSSTLGILTDRTMDLAADGSFRITLGGEGQGRNHIALKPGLISVGTRDILGDWRMRATRLAIRQTGGPAAPTAALSATAMRDQVLKDLPGYIGFWAHFPEIWFGGLQPNTHSQPMGRTNGWGYVAGLRFELQPGEAMVVNTLVGGAEFTGFQLNDLWMIQPDARRYQVSLNNSQRVLNADGTATYVISAEDPGVANWLDPAGVSSGFGILRWQQIPADLKPDGLIRDLRVIKQSEVAALGLKRVTPAERRAAIARRGWEYSGRTRF